MRTGPWLVDPTGAPAAGTVGVIVDSTLGGAILAARPSVEHWSLTTEMSLDFGMAVPTDGSVLECVARAVHTTKADGLSVGEVRDATGGIVAVATHRQRFVTGMPTDGYSTPYEDVLDRSGSVTDLLRAEVATSAEAATLTVPGGPLLANPSGIAHGGVMLCLAELAAAGATGDAPMRTSSLRIGYLRPMMLDGHLRLEAEVVHRSRSLGVVEVRGLSPEGKLAMRATVVRETTGD